MELLWFRLIQSAFQHENKFVTVAYQFVSSSHNVDFNGHVLDQWFMFEKRSFEFLKKRFTNLYLKKSPHNLKLIANYSASLGVKTESAAIMFFSYGRCIFISPWCEIYSDINVFLMSCCQMMKRNPRKKAMPKG